MHKLWHCCTEYALLATTSIALACAGFPARTSFATHTLYVEIQPVVVIRVHTTVVCNSYPIEVLVSTVHLSHLAQLLLTFGR